MSRDRIDPRKCAKARAGSRKQVGSASPCDTSAAMKKLALLLCIAGGTALARPIELSDQFKVWRLSDVSISPDGHLVAFTATTQDRNANKKHVALYVVPAAGGAPVAVASAG